MNREIKFRGISDSEPHRWIYGMPIQYGDGVLMVPDCPVSNNGRGFIITPKFVIPETVGQYTGLNDKNGKEIYLSDLIFTAIGISSSNVAAVHLGDTFDLMKNNGYYGYYCKFTSFSDKDIDEVPADDRYCQLNSSVTFSSEVCGSLFDHLLTPTT